MVTRWEESGRRGPSPWDASPTFKNQCWGLLAQRQEAWSGLLQKTVFLSGPQFIHL
jgi:hypothetical protein